MAGGITGETAGELAEGGAGDATGERGSAKVAEAEGGAEGDAAESVMASSPEARTEDLGNAAFYRLPFSKPGKNCTHS